MLKNVKCQSCIKLTPINANSAYEWYDMMNAKISAKYDTININFMQ